MKILKDINIDNKTVLLRVDFNVPTDETGAVTDTARIAETKPTIEYLRQHNAKIVIMAHFGRPKGQVVEKLRFKNIVPTISTVLGVEVKYVAEELGEGAGDGGKGIGSGVEGLVKALQPGEVFLLENIRFYPGEETNDPAFAKQLAALGDVYVNDAFGAAHRAHASTAGVAAYLPHAAGSLMQKEVEELTKVSDHPVAPVVAIIGGAKISTKIALIKNLLPKVDSILLGGALANTLLLAQQHPVGKSLVEGDLIASVKGLLSDKVCIPEDVVVAKTISEQAEARVVPVVAVEADDIILDIGPATIKAYVAKIAQAKTILWNGPMGMFEFESFAMGTFQVARAVAESGAYSVLGGGETVSAIHQLGLADKVSFVSTGGGAMLEFLEGKVLPGIAALN